MTVKTVSNRDVILFAKAGKDANGYGAVSTNHYREGFTRYGAPYIGYLPKRVAEILNARFREGAISQVVYSYGTPIAWKDGDTWIRPDVSYSVTTSKHQGSLYRLNNLKDIPFDAGMDEYLRVLEGHAVYTRGYGKIGSYRAAHWWEKFA